MGTDRLADLTKDPNVYPGFGPALAVSMTGELDRLYDDIVWSGTGSLRELFTTNQSFADPSLAALYGISVTGTDFAPVTLDPATRPGVLTRAGFLAVHANIDSSGPITRGVYLLRSIMCTPPNPPPPNVPAVAAATDPSVQGLTTRQRYAKHVSNAFCASCHDQIDGLGFGFEEFDAIGALRTLDNGQPVDDTGTVIGTGEIDGDFTGAAELTARLSGSRLLARCYARQTYRYALGEVEGANQDLRFLYDAAAPDSRLTDAWLAVIKSDAFTVRNFE
jgi:hypothetical protein